MKFLIPNERPQPLIIDHENGNFSAVELKHASIQRELKNKTIESYINDETFIIKYSLKQIKNSYPYVNENEFLTLNELLLLEGI